MENKNLIIALVLMLVVWGGFTFFFQPPPPPAGAPGPAAVSESAGDTSAGTTTADLKQTEAGPADADAASEPTPAARPRQVTVETPLYTAVLTNAGARIQSFALKEFGVRPGPEASRVTLVEADRPQAATLRSSGTGGILLPPEALYHVDLAEESLRVGAGEQREIVFRHRSATGLLVEKIYRFSGEGYGLDLKVRVRNQGSETVGGTLQVSLIQPWDEEMAKDSYAFVGPATLVGDKVRTEKVEDLAKEPQVFAQDVVWTAFESKYFITAVVPLGQAGEKTLVEKVGDTVENTVESPSLSLPPGGSAELGYFLFFGPRDLDILRQVDHQLAKAIDFGFFSPIARPLLWVLKFFYQYVGNYGIAIIVLTVIIKLLFWPLTQKSYSSMKAMQKLQPEMQKIREKFKNDRERLNKEIMELYRDNRVNPLGGCLPMVIQIPVFFALYKVLMDSIELRHAPFALWITDLSAKDPYYITPLVMGATMFMQQKMTPNTMDPMQQKMFLLMPVIFTFLFLNFPSGLVIYWLVNNLLTIAQQFFINRKA